MQILTPEFIQKISALVLKNTGGEINSPAGTYNSANGDFRLSAVYIAKYFPDYRKAPQMVKELNFLRYTVTIRQESGKTALFSLVQVSLYG